MTCVSTSKVSKESVVMGSFAVSVCCALVSLPDDCWCGAFVFTRTHMHLAEKPRVRRHASACGDMLIECSRAAISVLRKFLFREGS